VDIILIEPELDDALMFGTSSYKAIAERHGIEISARRVRHVMDQVERARQTPAAWRRVLEQTTAALMRSGPKPPREAPADDEALDA
jgi:alkylated DNA nucleotide flippase Atl1